MIFHHARIELSRSNVLSNIQTTRKALRPQTKLFAVVKSNAYGHGLKEIISVANSRTDAFCFAGTEEALVAREFTRSRIIALSYFATLTNSHLNNLQQKGIEVPLFDTSTLQALKKTRKKIMVHLKIDTGTTRIGFLPAEVKKVSRELKKYPHINVIGIYSHFAQAENPNAAFTKIQQSVFERSAQVLEQSLGKKNIERHMACSAALATNPETHYDAVRLGIHLYGLSGLPTKQAPTLNPVLSWVTHLIQVKHVPAGTTVGYNRTYKTKKKAVIGVLPVGYADGYPRQLSHIGHVIVRGKKAPIRGIVCMNLTMIELTHIPKAKAGDEVILLGEQKRQKITADTIAKQIHSINYEIVTRIHPSLERRII